MSTINVCIEEAAYEVTLMCGNSGALDTAYSKQGLHEEVAHFLPGSFFVVFLW